MVTYAHSFALKGRFLLPEGILEAGALVAEKGKILYAGPAQTAPEGVYEEVSGILAPGFVDIHTHGAMNEDFSDGKPDGLTKMSRYYGKNGVTSFLATTMTLKEDTLMPAMEAIREFGCTRLGARIWDLVHKDGYNITVETVTEKNRFGKSVSFARYRFGQ